MSVPLDLATFFDLLEFEYFFYYVWILDFPFFGSNATDERLIIEMYIKDT